MVAARALWKGHLQVSLVSCAVKLYPATTRANRVTFHNLNRETHNRIALRPHDAETGDEIARDELVKGYEFEKGRYVLVPEEEIAAVRIPSTKTIEIEQFVEAADMDLAYYDAPYFIVPDGLAAGETYRVLRGAMEERRKIGIGRVVLSRRERVVAVEPRDGGILMTTLHARDEMRDAASFFEEIGEGELDEEMIQLAADIIRRKEGKFEPETFEDRYQKELTELVQAKMRGETPAPPKPRPTAEVINLRDALKRSLEAAGGKPPAGNKPSARSKPQARKKPASKRK